MGKVMSRYLVNIWQSISTLLIGMGITIRHLIKIRKGNVTLQYPKEKWPQPQRKIGFDPKIYNVIRSKLDVDIDDCIGCLKCVRACPVDCIIIETVKVPKGTDIGTTSNNTKKRLLVKRFDIDMTECLYCNLCVYPCPEECIYMTGGPNSEKKVIDYEFSKYDRRELLFRFAKITEKEIAELTVEPIDLSYADEPGVEA